MSELALPLVLASASPRRREILEALGLEIEVVPSRVEEVRRAAEAPAAYVERLAAEKALEVATRLGAGDRFVLGADTTVVVGGELLEKPLDDDDSRAMIERLAGRAHEVVTGVSIARATGTLAAISVTTEVVFRTLTPAEIDGYVATGEGRDKAGAYAVQGIGSGIVEAIRGSYTNVVGLPAVETVLLLKRVGALRRWP